ncbi:hypothetical protein QUA54_21840 [Microcoleus sp. MOSTC5]
MPVERRSPKTGAPLEGYGGGATAAAASVRVSSSSRFRLHGNDKVKLNNSTFPDSRLPTPHHSGVTGIDITRPLLSHSIYYFCRFATRGLFSGGIPQNPVAARAKTN